MSNKVTIHAYHEVEVSLLPCPFCGADDRHTVKLRKSSSTVRVENRISRVECLKCGATVTSNGQVTTDQEAVEKWNKRYAPN